MTLRLFPGWVVVGGAFSVLSVAYALQFSYGVFLPEIVDDLGWTRTEVSGAYAAFVVAYTGLSFWAGRYTDRLGPRLVVAVGALALGAGYALLGTMTRHWELYVYLAGLAAVGVSVAFVPCNATVVRWFVKRRGLALGIASSGISFASLIGPLIAAVLIGAFEWRTAIVCMGLGGGLVMLVASRVLIRDPESLGLRPDGEAGATRAGDPVDGWSLSEARRTPAYWLLFGALTLTWLFVFLPFVHLAAHARDLGYGVADGAGLISAIGAGGLIGRVASGALTDRLGRIPGLVLALIVQILTFLGFAASLSLAGLYAAALAFGFAYSGVSVLFPALLGDYFGRAHAGEITGFAFALGGAAAGIGPLLAGMAYDLLGEYQVAFLLGAITNSLALVLIAFLRRPRPRFAAHTR